MNFSQIINTRSIRNAVGKSVAGILPQIIASTPLSAILQSIQKYRKNQLESLLKLDAIAAPLNSCSTLLDSALDYYEKVSYEGTSIINAPVIRISDEEAEYIMSGLLQASGEHFTITTRDGMKVSVVTDDNPSFIEVGPFQYPAGWVYASCRAWSPSDWSSKEEFNNDNTILLKRVFDIEGNYWLLSTRLLKFNINDQTSQLSNATDMSIWDFMDQINSSGTLSQSLIELCDSCRASSPGELLDSLEDKYAKYPDIKSVLARARQSFASGGFKGLYQWVCSVVESSKSLTDDDGVLVWTDNKAYMPSDYIIGMIGALISAVSSIISAILAIIQPVIGVMLNMVGGLVSGVVTSFAQDINNTRSTWVATPDSLAYPFAPFALWQNIVNIPEWYDQYYLSGNPVVLLEVVGGYILLGPSDNTRSFYDSLNAGNNPDRSSDEFYLNYEFHPSIYGINETSWFRNLSSSAKQDLFLYDSAGDRVGRNKHYFSSAYASEITQMWETARSENVTVNYGTSLTESGTTMSSFDDLKLFRNICFNLFMLLRYMSCFGNASSVLPASANFILNSLNGIVNKDDYPMNKFANIVYGLLFYGDSFTVEWDNLIKACNLMNDSFSSILLTTTDGQSTNYTIEMSYVTMHDFISSMTYYNDPIMISNSYTPCFLPPKYTASTFWLYVSLGALLVAATTTIAVIGAVKFVKWSKQRRLNNKLSFDEAYENYNRARQGDPDKDGHPTFDPNSPEGQEYVAGRYKQLKRTTLRNNIEAKIIGGSRYDPSTFWGEKEVADESEVVPQETALPGVIDSAFFTTPAPTDLAVDPESDSLAGIATLIRGFTSSN